METILSVAALFLASIFIVYNWEKHENIDPDYEYLYTKTKKLYKVYLSLITVIFLSLLIGASIVLSALNVSNYLGLDLQKFGFWLGRAWIIFGGIFVIENGIYKYQIIKKVNIDDE